jgi:hypothetical protein
MDTALTIAEAGQLAAQEAVIERGLKTFVDVGNALLTIRDGRLYRASHGTFEDYCRERWGMTDRRARQLMGAAETIALLQTGTIVPVLPITESQARPLTALPPERQAEAWQAAVETAPDGKVTAAHVQAVVDAMREPDEPQTLWEPVAEKPHVAFISGENEWYTPPEFIEAARQVLRYIDLDPASSDIANRVVGATRYFTKADDGLAQDWAGRVWMNPPYASALIKQFAAKYAQHVIAGDITEGIVLVNNATETEWFEQIVRVSTAVVFPRSRVKFLDPNGEPGAPLQGQAILYLGTQPDWFLEVFERFGWGASL